MPNTINPFIGKYRPNTYLSLYKQVRELPLLYSDATTMLPGNKISYFSKGLKEYDKGGAYLTSPFKENPQVRLTEEYFRKIKGFTWFSEQPFFKKVSETKKLDRAEKDLDLFVVETTRTNGKGKSSLTTYDINGIKTTKVTQRLNPETQQYEYTRLVFNDRGTKPQIVAKWSGEYQPLDELSI